MSQITLDIPDGKMDFFMELMKNLGFVKMNGANNVLSDLQIKLVEDARKKAEEKPESLTEWDVAAEKIDWDAR